IKTSSDLYSLLVQTWDTTKLEFMEQLKVVLLNRANRILGICTISTGNATSTIADPKIVFGVALKANAVCIVLAHNHPSGNLMPSKADIELTKKMVECGRFLD